MRRAAGSTGRYRRIRYRLEKRQPGFPPSEHAEEPAEDLAEAIESGEVVAHFQPLVSLAGNTLLGFEALARWDSPRRGWMHPAQFVPLAERLGLTAALGERILGDACRALATWRRATPRHDLTVSVNVSDRQLSTPGFPDAVAAAVAAAGIPPELLSLEVTESVLKDLDGAAEVLRRLKEIGVAIALDDFGIGYSSLARLHRFPLDSLKIDRSFVDSLDEGPQANAIVAAVVGLAGSLGLHTVAEGIEEPRQAERLRSLGCEAGQGHLWSPAVDGQAALALLHAAGTGAVPLAPGRRAGATTPR